MGGGEGGKGGGGEFVLVKDPATRLVTRSWTLKAVSAAISSPGAGEVMMDEIMFCWLGISPITIPLQLPAVTCAPFVSVLPVQKLMKLALSVSESAWAGSPPPSCPVAAEASCTFAGSRASAASPAVAFPPGGSKSFVLSAISC